MGEDEAELTHPYRPTERQAPETPAVPPEHTRPARPASVLRELGRLYDAFVAEHGRRPSRVLMSNARLTEYLLEVTATTSLRCLSPDATATFVGVPVVVDDRFDLRLDP